jgi:hypothetical protein
MRWPFSLADLFFFFYAEDAAKQWREQRGGSGQYDLHISTPYVKI